MNYLSIEPKPLTAPRIECGCITWRDEKRSLRVLTSHAYLTSILKKDHDSDH